MYSLLKVTHLGAFMLWLGPALGSWLVLRYMQQQEGETSRTTALVYKVFFLTLTLEHIAFCILLVSGGWMAYSAGWLHAPWLQQKLWLVLGLIIPLEIADIWLGNWQVKKLVTLRSKGQSLTPSQQTMVDFYHHGFTRIALVLLPVTVLLIMWLAVSKQALW